MRASGWRTSCAPSRYEQVTIELIPEALARAITAAETLGLETAQARAVARTIEERGGYPGELYVLGLAGGTGVGKSSLLNAIAGGEVSPAGARRPTTTAPVALLPAEYGAQAAPLLEWLGGAEARTWAGDGAADGAGVAIVDLPDLDSVEPAHAARVDAVLPRIDAVVWVTDPEKYDDAVLHDRYLRRWMPRLARQVLVVNKSDRLAREDVRRVCDDLRARLRAEGLPEVPVLGVSARNDPAPLREWLLDGVSAKEIVRARLQQSALDAVRALAAAAGAADPSAPDPLIAPTLGDQAAALSSDALLDLLGPRGLRDQAKAAVWTEARSRGGGPIERARTLLERGSGLTAQRADPEGYLRRWRERGSLDRATAPVRQVLLTAAGALPAPLRPNVLAGADPAVVGARLTRGLDAVVRSAAVARDRPHSRLWPAFGLLQLAATASVVGGAIWVVVLFAVAGATPTGSVDLPVLGPMPTPAALILVGLLSWFALDRLLHWQAHRLGDRWADAILEQVSPGVSACVAEVIDARLASLDEARAALWSALRELERIPAQDHETHPGPPASPPDRP